MLVELNSKVVVNPEEVSSIEIDGSYGRGVRVRMRNGHQYWVDNIYGKTAYETCSILTAKINTP